MTDHCKIIHLIKTNEEVRNVIKHHISEGCNDCAINDCTNCPIYTALFISTE